MRVSHPKVLIAVLLGCLLIAGCDKKIVQKLSEVSNLQTKIVEKFGDKQINVYVTNDSILTVNFINSPLNAKNSSDRAQRAQQTATFVTQHYPSVAKLEVIWVGFVKQETRYLFVNFSELLETFPFDRNAHIIPTSERGSSFEPAPTAFQPAVVYVPHSNQTDISLPAFQLEGTLEEGLALAVRFSVEGDAASGFRRPPPPAFVGFDFASYSPNAVMREEKKISLLADDQVVFEKKEVFTTTKQGDDIFSEFLLMKIPYPKFKKLARAKKAVIRIGDKDYELTEEQVAGLQEMTTYVAE